MPDTNTEGSNINEDSMSEGYTATLTATRYDKGYDITREMLIDDLQGVFGGAGKVGGMVVGNAPQQLGKGFAQREEVSAAGVLTGGFGNTGYDGQATFSNSHPLADSSSVADNLASGALNPANLKTAITLGRTDSLDEAGLKSVVRFKYLVVPPALEFTANEILGSSLQAYEMSNTANSLGGLQIKVNDFFPATSDTYRNSNWFLISNDIDNIMFGWLEDPQFEVQKTPRRVDYFALGYMRFAVGTINFRGLIGSTGA
jgi:phage major head subunit gpT-like protein